MTQPTLSSSPLTDRSQTPLPAAQVDFRFSNGSRNLSHFVVYDYYKWNDPNNEDIGLFCIDYSTDNMNEAKAELCPAAQGDVYLVRAYFDFRDDIEMIVQRTGKDLPFELSIYENVGGPYLVLGKGIKELSEMEAQGLIPNE